MADVAPALLEALASVLDGEAVVGVAGVVLGALVTPVDGVIAGMVLGGVVVDGAVDGVLGSAMLPFEEFVVTPLFFDVSDCVVLGAVELGWVVDCCAAAGTASAVSNTAAIVHR